MTSLTVQVNFTSSLLSIDISSTRFTRLFKISKYFTYLFNFSFGKKNLIGLVFGANVALSAVVKGMFTSVFI